MDGRDDAQDLKLQPLYYTTASSEGVSQLKSKKAFLGKIKNISHHFFLHKTKNPYYELLEKPAGGS